MKILIKSMLMLFLLSYGPDNFSATSAVIEVESPAHFNELIKNNPNIVVEFYAPWCPHCQSVMGIYDQVARSVSSVVFARVNKDNLPSVFKQMDITGIPTVNFFKNGEVRNTIVGVKTPENFKSRVETAANQLLSTR